MSKAGLLRSMRGSNGGFAPGKPANEIKMRAVIVAIDGPVALNRCLIREGECEEEGGGPSTVYWRKLSGDS